MVKHFRQENAKISIYDPKVPEHQIWLDLTEPGVTDDTAIGTSSSPHRRSESELTEWRIVIVKSQVTVCKSAEQACIGAEGIIVATEWDEFKTLDWQKIYDSMAKPAFVFDGRLILDAAKLRQIGFRVDVIGRGESE